MYRTHFHAGAQACASRSSFEGDTTPNERRASRISKRSKRPQHKAPATVPVPRQRSVGAGVAAGPSGPDGETVFPRTSKTRAECVSRIGEKFDALRRSREPVRRARVSQLRVRFASPKGSSSPQMSESQVCVLTDGVHTSHTDGNFTDMDFAGHQRTSRTSRTRVETDSTNADFTGTNFTDNGDFTGLTSDPEVSDAMLTGGTNRTLCVKYYCLFAALNGFVFSAGF